MPLEISKNSITQSNTALCPTARQNIDVQLNLPDYCTDIKRILKCCVEPGVSSVSLKGEKLSATGGVTIRLIYVSDDDKTDCYETRTDLDVSTEINGNLQNVTVTAFCKTDYVNCRAMSQRRVYVSGSVTVNFSVLEERKKEFLYECKEDHVQLKKSLFKSRNIICQAEKSFDLSETVSLDSDKPDIGKILFANAFAVVDSKKTVTGKMLIKGELVCDVVYCHDKADNKLQKIRHTMPISQIIDLAGADEKSSCMLNLSVMRLMVNSKADSTGKNRLLEIAAKVSALAKCSETKEFSCVLDSYSTKCELKTENETVDFCVPVTEINETRTVRKSYELQKGIKEICNIKAEDISSKIMFNENRAVVSFSALLTVLYLDAKGVPSCAEKSFEFEYEPNLPVKNVKLSGEVSAIVKDISWLTTGKDSFEVSLDVFLQGEICQQTEERVVKNITVDETNEGVKENSALIIYYPQKGEKLWDIAKKYNTTVVLLKEENGCGEEIGEERMLIIPAM